MKKHTALTIFSGGWLIVSIILTFSALAQEEQPKKVEIIKLATVEGDIFMREGSLFAVDAGKKLYKITDKFNKNSYETLLSLAQEKLTKGKGIKARIVGYPGKFHSVIQQATKYDGEQISSKEEVELKYRDLDIVLIENTVESAPYKEEITTSSKIPLSRIKTPLAVPILKSVQGTVTADSLNKTIPYLEIKAKDTQKAIVILVPSDINAIKVVEGQLMGFTPKDVIKEDTQLEIWYEEQGDLNIARTITILPEPK